MFTENDYHSFKGTVVYVNGPASVWVIADKDIKLIEHYNAVLYEAAKTDPPLTTAEIGDMVSAPYQGGYYRAKIYGIRGSRAYIHFIDFGNKSNCQLQKLRPLPTYLARAKPIVFHGCCGLDDIPTPRQLNAFNNLVNSRYYCVAGRTDGNNPKFLLTDDDGKHLKFPKINCCWF